MAKTETHIPKLRFAGFAGYLDSSSLKEVALVKDGTHQTPEYTESGVKFLSVENIEKLASSNKFISEIDFENNFKIKPQLNDILMTRITAGEIGKTAIIKELPYAYYVSLALIRLNQKVSPNFFHQYAGSSYFKKELNKRIIHVAFPKKINLSDLGNCLLSYPSLQEQTKIGDFFQKIDQVIELQQKALDTARDYKKSMLQKMFPQKGEKVPQIRFDGFSGDWEEFSLGDIGNSFTGLSGKTKEDFGLGSPFITYKTIFAKSGIKNFIDCELVKIDPKEKQSIVRRGDIFFTTSSETPEEVGLSSVLLMNPKVNTYLNSFCFGVRILNPDILLPEFAQYLFRNPLSRKTIEVLAQGSTRFNISKSNFMKLIFYKTNIEEQQKIGAFFQKLDQQIEQQEKKLENYQQLKKAMLQRLFV